MSNEVVLATFDHRCLMCGARTDYVHSVVNVPLCGKCKLWAQKNGFVAFSVLSNLKEKYLKMVK
jgi:predicted nucleic acid-binding Zn ribbon protein